MPIISGQMYVEWTNFSREGRASEIRVKFDLEDVARALRKSWSRASARQWSAANPAAGQCSVTALLVYDLFGGELLKTSLSEGDHFYNRIGGHRYDFTDSQFTQPPTYSDATATRADAEQAATEAELAALKAAFRRHAAPSG
jgi:hypothetical protein